MSLVECPYCIESQKSQSSILVHSFSSNWEIKTMRDNKVITLKGEEAQKEMLRQHIGVYHPNCDKKVDITNKPIRKVEKQKPKNEDIEFEEFDI